MSDEQIIKGLECCISPDCKNCPYDGDDLLRPCNHNLMKDVLSLIKRQKAEIERLSSMVDAAEDYLHPLPFKNNFDKEIERARAEAIKEFAKKWKAKRVITYCTCGKRIDITENFNDCVDILVKEMTEDDGK